MKMKHRPTRTHMKIRERLRGRQCGCKWYVREIAAA